LKFRMLKVTHYSNPQAQHGFTKERMDEILPFGLQDSFSFILNIDKIMGR
jgi:hypothetical protein